MEKTSLLQDIALELYADLARRFPICCASDEFVFFPQAVEEETDWSRWDDLSPGSVEDAVTSLGCFRRRLGEFVRSGNEEVDGEGTLASALVWVTRTLEEQFTLVKTHSTQPTFALTVATVGLVQALQNAEEKAWLERVRTLPDFLEGALQSLREVPELYRDLGMEMAASLTRWIGSLGLAPQSGLALKALDSFTDRLSMISVTRKFTLPPDLFEYVVSHHTGNVLALNQVLFELEDEVSVTKQQLIAEAANQGCGRDWESVFSSIPGEQVPANGGKGLLRLEVERLRDHCLRHGFLGENSTQLDSLFIEFLPSSLDSIRAADSYNAIPGHPFRGGVFYIFGHGRLGSPSGSIHPVYRMTVAHETYPGHHLLDLSRWNNSQPALRSLEYPLFYEGWACFGEDLMLRTGAFDRSYDSLILLRRRFRHAVRGKVDLMLHSGHMSLEEAAEELMTAGFSRNRALDTVRKYALRPAYQMCYTIGRRRFQQLFDLYGRGGEAGFVNTVLTQGEILFEDMEWALERAIGKGEEEKRGRGEETVNSEP